MASEALHRTARALLVVIVIALAVAFSRMAELADQVRQSRGGGVTG
jgi:hypothetical protein